MVTKTDGFWNFFAGLAAVSLSYVLLVKWIPWLQPYQEYSLPMFALSFIFMTITMWETRGNVWYSMSGIVLMTVGGVLGYFGEDLVIGSITFVPGAVLWLWSAFRYCRDN